MRMNGAHACELISKWNTNKKKNSRNFILQLKLNPKMKVQLSSTN